MSEFLKQWDRACDRARETGNEAVVLSDHFHVEPWKGSDDCVVPVFRIVGRTMHPAFMSTPVPKHDPERDQ